MDKLILLIGASGSGKTTLAKELEKEGYNIIQSYTTREPREENEWGHEFIEFHTTTTEGVVITEVGLFYPNDMITQKKLYNGYYWATKDQYQGKGTSIYVIDPDGAEQVRENVKDAEIVTIFLMADEDVRYERVRDREFDNNNIPLFIPTDDLNRIEPTIENLLTNASERIEKDRRIFSKCKCDYVVDANRSIEEVLAGVKEIING